MEKTLLLNLKEEIKSELLNEIRQEVRATIIKEFKSIMFEERYFETMIKSYIKMLCYRDVNYLLMLNRGLVKHGASTHEIREHSTHIWMTKKKNIDLNKLYKEYKIGRYITCSYENFESAINFEPIENPGSDEETIAWTNDAKKKFTYKGLFDLYNKIYNENFSKMDKSLKKLFLAYISGKFKFEGVPKPFKLINKSFIKAYNWKDENYSIQYYQD